MRSRVGFHQPRAYSVVSSRAADFIFWQSSRTFERLLAHRNLPDEVSLITSFRIFRDVYQIKY